MSAVEFYASVVRTAPDCIHDVQGGDIIRPWCGTPACPFCRRRSRYTWRTLDSIMAGPAKPSNVTPLHGSRKLF